MEKIQEYTIVVYFDESTMPKDAKGSTGSVSYTHLDVYKRQV